MSLDTAVYSRWQLRSRRRDERASPAKSEWGELVQEISQDQILGIAGTSHRHLHTHGGCPGARSVEHFAEAGGDEEVKMLRMGRPPLAGAVQLEECLSFRQSPDIEDRIAHTQIVEKAFWRPSLDGGVVERG